MSDATDRLLCADLLRAPVEADGVSAALSTASATLAEEVGVEVGLWEAGPGSDTDVEVDEVFLVLEGAGSVAFADGSHLVLAPGVLVRLHAGDRTVWHLTERLRKLYLSPPVAGLPTDDAP